MGRITTEIEASKSHFTEKLEHLRAELSSRSHYGKVRYEREMKIFEEIWPNLCTLRDAVLSLRPVIDFGLKPEETEEERKQKRAERFFEAWIALRKTVDHSRPFYPPTIWAELRTLLDLTHGESVDYRSSSDRNREDYWDKAMANSEAINKQVDKTCEAIRSRLTAFDDA